MDDCPNLVELLRRRAAGMPRRAAFRSRRDGRWRNVTWAAARATARAAAAALVAAGVGPGDRVALLSPNRVEWVLADLAVHAAGAICVPIHNGLPPTAAAGQLLDSGARWLFCATTIERDAVLAALGGRAGTAGVTLFEADDWAAFLEAGRLALPARSAELDRRAAALKPTDPALILYTSGTTGDPKGVILTHGNLLANASALHRHLPFEPNATVLNWLPLSHAYARTSDLTQCLVAGATLALAGSPETLRRDLLEVRPHHVHGVPRLYEKVLADTPPHRLGGAFGGRVGWLMSGGAPLPPPVAGAYAAAGLCLLQGYGLTEAGPVVSADRPGHARADTVGHPLPGVEVRLGADGELFVRGPGLTPGYWNRPDLTSAALPGGWLATGDLAELTAEGSLRITGRKKDLIVLSTGRKIQPSAIENALRADPCIDQVVVFGDGRPALAALIVPRWSEVERVLGRDRLSADDPAVRELLSRRLAANQESSATWERVRSLAILDEPFRVETGELTVSLKPRREVILSRHGGRLSARAEAGLSTVGSP
jgi:long-chain acyl-CoA synthetase